MTDPSPARLGSGNLNGAIENVSRIAAAAEREGNLPLAAIAHGSLAVALARAGNRPAADAAMGEALGLARRADHLGAKTMVSWRYVSMLNVLDRPGEATALAARLLDAMRGDDPADFRREAHQVSADVAAARGDWAAVRKHCLELTDLAENEPSAAAQALVGAAHAATRSGDTASARRDATRALTLATPQSMDGLRASALTVLMGLDAVPSDIDVRDELTAIATRAEQGGDTAGAAATWTSLGRWLRERGEKAEGRRYLDSAIASADLGGHVFAWGKAHILRADTHASRDATIRDLATGWAALTQVVAGYEDPAGRQEMLIDWRATVDIALAALTLGTAPLSEREAQLAVEIFETSAIDAVRESVARGADERGPSIETESAKALDIPTLCAASGGGAVVAYRVLRATEELLAGWRLSIDDRAHVRVERFEISGAPAAEIKLIAERHPGAPTDDQALWRDLARSLIPADWSWSRKHLAVVPHGPLWLVPWPALNFGDALADPTPSLTTDVRTALTLGTLTRQPQQATRTVRSAVIAIDPRITGALADADNLTARFGDAAAVVQTAAALTDAIARHPDLLILSAHGSGRGPDWTLRLADTAVTVADLTNQQLPPLLIAASCMSGRQGLEPWPPSLVAACFNSGVTVMVGGIWDLPDAATSEFVRDIIDRAASNGASIRETVRSTQQRMRREGRPLRDWAGVTVFER